MEYLTEKNVRTVAVEGLQTDYCIDATIKCGFEHGFEMIVPENANSTFGNALWQERGVISIITSLCGRADMRSVFLWRKRLNG